MFVLHLFLFFINTFLYTVFYYLPISADTFVTQFFFRTHARGYEVYIFISHTPFSPESPQHIVISHPKRVCISEKPSSIPHFLQFSGYQTLLTLFPYPNPTRNTPFSSLKQTNRGMEVINHTTIPHCHKIEQHSSVNYIFICTSNKSKHSCKSK